MQNPKLINAIVTKPFDISKMVKKYIHEHQSTEQTPFNFITQRKNKTIHNSSYNNDYNQFDRNQQYNNGYFQTSGRKKTMLSDWRMLYQQKKQKNKDKIIKDSRKQGDNLGDNQEIENSQNKITNLNQIPKNYASDKKFKPQQPKAHTNSYRSRTNYKYKNNAAVEYSLHLNTTPYKLIKKSQYNTPKSQNPTNQPLARSAFKFNLKHGAKNPNKTTSSFRQTNLQSAIVQNLYQEQYIKQRKIQTAKIKRHYQRNHQQRPLSINRQQFVQSNVRPFTSDKFDRNCKEEVFQKLNFDLEKIDLINIKIKQYAITNSNNISNSPNNKNKNKIVKNSKILKDFKFPEKYEKVKIKGTSIRRYKDIVIEGIKQKQDFTNIQGLRFYGTNA